MLRSERLNVLGLSGSLRKKSFNTAALRAAQDLSPANMEIRIQTLEKIPPYDDDLRNEGFPSSVTALGTAIDESDAVLIATPEYNYSIPGVLKNAIDWLSRLPDQPFDGKPIAIMGASPGRLGTARAQYHLRQVFVFLNGQVMNRPEVMIGGAMNLFDEGGQLLDESTRQHVAKLLESLAAHARRSWS